MSKLVLHIGTHKTGTTAIQRILAANRSLLQRRGIIYPRFALGPNRQRSAARQLWVNSRNRLAQIGVVSAALDGSVGHHGLLAPWVDLPAELTTAAPPEALLDKLCRSHADSPRTVILSSEEFSRANAGRSSDGPNLKQIRQMIAAFSEIQVICFLRHQIPFLQSLYLEVSKTLVPPCPSVLAGLARKTGYSAGMFMDFNLLLTRLRQAFAKDTLTFIDYAEAAQTPQGVAGALLCAAGHQELAGELQISGSGRANVSAMPLAVWAANQVHAPDPSPHRLIGAAGQTLQRVFGSPPDTTLFSRKEYAALARHFARRNRKFEARVNKALAKGPAKPPANPPAPFQLSGPGTVPDRLVFREDLQTDFWIRLCQVLDRAQP